MLYTCLSQDCKVCAHERSLNGLRFWDDKNSVFGYIYIHFITYFPAELSYHHLERRNAHVENDGFFTSSHREIWSSDWWRWISRTQSSMPPDTFFWIFWLNVEIQLKKIWLRWPVNYQNHCIMIEIWQNNHKTLNYVMLLFIMSKLIFIQYYHLRAKHSRHLWITRHIHNEFGNLVSGVKITLRYWRRQTCKRAMYS